MPNYPNTDVEREVRSRVNGAMEELIRKRDAELRELGASKYAPGPGMGSGPYEQMRVRVSINFYEALFQHIVDTWVDVLTRQNGKISASDVTHIVQELEARASVAPTHIRQALASRGPTAHLQPPGAMKALEDGARQRMNELVAKHRRELQTRLYNQDHPHPGEVPRVPNINIKINSDNTNSTVTSGHGNKVAPDTAKKGWWETWWGVVVTSVIAGLVIWGITRYFDTPAPSAVQPKPKVVPTAPATAQPMPGQSSVTGTAAPLGSGAASSPQTAQHKDKCIQNVTWWDVPWTPRDVASYYSETFDCSLMLPGHRFRATFDGTPVVTQTRQAELVPNHYIADSWIDLSLRAGDAEGKGSHSGSGGQSAPMHWSHLHFSVESIIPQNGTAEAKLILTHCQSGDPDHPIGQYEKVGWPLCGMQKDPPATITIEDLGPAQIDPANPK